ncbi:MAG: DNA methylase [Acetatifactor sp.]|nr:DNA methylase [Acetatifactor sp.]
MCGDINKNNPGQFNKKQKEHTYIAIDLKSFYASVECVERGLDPLTTNLVVADASRTEKTICLAVTPALKAYGLSGRSRLFEVESKVAEVKARTGRTMEYIAAVPRMSLYIEYSSRIYEIYLDFFAAEDIHVYSIDEVFIDATDYLKLYRIDARELTKRVIKKIYDTTGITATAGIAPNLFLCKVAMDIVAKHEKADEDGVRIAYLDEMKFRETLWDHKPLTDFWRIGAGTVRKLAQNGMYTLGDLARMSLHSEEWLFKIFGIDAEILIDHAWGYEPCTIKDIKNYKPKSNSLSSGQVLSCPYDYKKAKIIVKEMAGLLSLDLVEKNLVTDSLTVDIGYDRISVDSGEYTGEVHIDFYGRMVPKGAHGTANLGSHTSSTERIVAAVDSLFTKIADPTLFVRRVNISANNTVTAEYEQLDIFSYDPHSEKEKKVQKAMLEIQKRFGKNALLKATNLEEGATTIERNSQIGGHRA